MGLWLIMSVESVALNIWETQANLVKRGKQPVMREELNEWDNNGDMRFFICFRADIV